MLLDNVVYELLLQTQVFSCWMSFRRCPGHVANLRFMDLKLLHASPEDMNLYSLADVPPALSRSSMCPPCTRVRRARTVQPIIAAPVACPDISVTTE